MENEISRETVAPAPSHPGATIKKHTFQPQTLAKVKKSGPPGILTQPNCRGARELARSGNFYTFLKMMHEDFGDIVSLSPALYLLVPAEIVKGALKTPEDFRKADSIETFKMLAGEGLFSADGASYDEQEKTIKSAFGRKYFADFRRVIEEDMTNYIDRRFEESKLTNKPFDIVSLSVDVTMSIAARSFFGIAGEDEKAQKFRKGLVYVQDWYAALEATDFAEPMLTYTEDHFIRLPFLRELQRKVIRKISGSDKMAATVAEWRRMSTEEFPKAFDTAKAMRKICSEIIELRRQDKDFDSKNDILSTLLRLQGDQGNSWLTDENIIDQVATFFVAGHETTSDLFTILFWKHARGETPAAVIKEMREARGLVTEEKMLFQKYQATYEYMKEVLLDHPPVPFTVRQTTRDMEVQGFFIPKDSKIILSPYVTRDIDVVFGFGRRQCVGRMFALEEVVIGLHHLVNHSLKLENPSQELEQTQGLTIGYSRSRHPVLARSI